MGKGFAPVLPTGNKAQLKPELPLTSINEIQASFDWLFSFLCVKEKNRDNFPEI